MITEGLLLVAFGTAIGMLGVCRPIGPYDEGLVLCSARRILAGELPYRDFFAPYPPGQSFMAAGLFATFGETTLTLRVYCVLVRSLMALALYLVARRLAGRTPALACWAACILWLASFASYGYPSFPALLLVLLSLSVLASCLDGARERPPRLRMFVAGGLWGLAGLIRHDFAVYALLASVPSLVALARPPNGAARAPSASGAGLVGGYAAGFALAFGVPALTLLAWVPAREVWFELVVYATRIYPETRWLPYPPLLAGASTPGPRILGIDLAAVPFYAPLLLYLLAFIAIGVRSRGRWREAGRDPQDLRLASLALFGTLAFNLARVRADLVHAVAMILPSYVVAAALVRGAGPGRWRRPWQAVIVGVCLLSLVQPLRQMRGVVVGAPARCRDAGADREAAAAFLREVVPPGQRILVACGRHDKVFVNEPVLYFLADRLPCTLYHSFDPGVTTTLAAQREIVGGLIRHRVEYVIRSDETDAMLEPNASATSSGVTHLDDYLRSHYEVRRRFGAHVTVWRRSAGWERAPDG